MGLLEKLWDDTLAGPRPETGLGRLRKHASFSPRSDSGKGFSSAAEVVVGGGIARVLSGDLTVEMPRVTRSIMIKRPAGCPSPVSGTPPASPAGSTPPVSPFSDVVQGERIGTDFGGNLPLMHLRELEEEEGWQRVPLLLMRCELC